MQRTTIHETTTNGRRVHDMLAVGMYMVKICCNAMIEETAKAWLDSRALK